MEPRGSGNLQNTALHLVDALVSSLVKEFRRPGQRTPSTSRPAVLPYYDEEMEPASLLQHNTLKASMYDRGVHT